jgi:hypothetical protein
VGLWISFAMPDWAPADVAVITALSGPAVCRPLVSRQLASTKSPTTTTVVPKFFYVIIRSHVTYVM